ARAPRTIPSAGDDTFAVGAERHAPHLACEALEGEEFLTRRGVPHLRLGLPAWVTSAGDNALAVGAERHAAHRGCVPPEGKQFPASLGVPHPCRAVLTADDDTFAVGAEGHAPHRACVPQQGLFRVDSRPQVVMLPAAQAPLALVEVL